MWHRAHLPVTARAPRPLSEAQDFFPSSLPAQGVPRKEKHLLLQGEAGSFAARALPSYMTLH